MTQIIQSALVRAIDSGRRFLPLVRTAHESHVVKVGPDVLLRDAMYRMNEVFATEAAVVSANGALIGWLSQELLVALFEDDSDQALRTPCGDIIARSEQAVVAA